MDFVDEIYKNLEAQGITDPEEQKRRVAQAISRQTSERFVTEGMMNRGQIHDERERMAQGMGTQDAFNTFGNESVTNNMKAMSNAWDNLLIAVAGPNSQNAIAVMKSLTGAINSVTAYVNTLDPSTITNLAAGIAALAVVLTGAGMVAIIAALGTAGWIAAGILAVGFAAAKWGPDVFKGVWSTLEGAAALLTQALNGITSAISGFIDQIMALYHRVTGSSALPAPQTAPNAYGNWTPAQKLAAGIAPVSFNPANDTQRSMQASFSLNVDGRALAQTVIDHLESIYGMPTAGASADGMHSPFADQWSS
jgi:hypothetical protein